MSTARPDIGCYYFPGYHPDPRVSAFHGDGWTEWELLSHATPRFAGHRQPRTPAWGHENEADPAVMAKKIDAAADHGIDVFIFDWYWYENRAFLEGALNDGFIRAPNHGRMKFALMWANHDWVSIFPARMNEPRSVVYPGRVTLSEWAALCDHIVHDYFASPAYYRIDGAAYFSIYDVDLFLRSFGGPAGAAAAIEMLRTRAERHGVGAVHLNAVVWRQAIVPREGDVRFDLADVAGCGFDSMTSYVWIHHAALGDGQTVAFDAVEEMYHEYWRSVTAAEVLPYFPNVSVGWDSSPRTVMTDYWDPGAGYPYTPVVTGSTPERFRTALERMRDGLPPDGSTRLLTVNSWNEWTEGSYLEPDATHGFGYLEAIRSVFGASAGSP